MNHVDRVLERADPGWLFPPTPPLERAVLERLGARRRPRLRLRWLAPAVAAAILSSPRRPWRAAVLDWLGLGTVELRWAERLPPATRSAALVRGPRDARAGARRSRPSASSSRRSTTSTGRPPSTTGGRPGDMVTFVYEADGRPAPRPQPVALARVDVREGAPARDAGRARPGRRRAGPVDRWPRARGVVPRCRRLVPAGAVRARGADAPLAPRPISFRLEADVPRAEALRIARSLR